MESKKIWLSIAQMGGSEQQYINDAFEKNWVTPLGPNVTGFEKDIESFLNQECHVVALSSGTAAIHLALIQLGIGAGDEVICQSFTFSASANPIVYQCAMPIFVDSEIDTWNISPILLEKAILDRKMKTGKYPKAIIIVDLYGMPVKMDEILIIASQYNIPIIEDAAEALGSEYKGRKCGTFGAFGVLSFNGNKIITTSGGGALICKRAEQAKETVFLATQAKENRPYYYHEKIGYNYRLSNICAGIGRGQMEVLPQFLSRRREINSLYSELFADVEGVYVMQCRDKMFNSNYWLTCIIIDDTVLGVTVNDIRLYLDSVDIESRLLWKPLHMQPVFDSCPAYIDGTSERLFRNGLCLPSSPALTNKDVEKVVTELKKYICDKGTEKLSRQVGLTSINEIKHI
ncbi:DegT/DnrJ/EryC1/StrS family aminotransferase [Dysgonomonas sp. Marseille-P4677]|uniref:DegT/DnrJ/EryC1/StrS family aminotransferase n=1 Tax=Dysgonomonas sp. Marseille-P4677 TaxID=2364790 RepID=UPI00191492E6|nr:DegT/DnrJ/EryC1/StrS family aminotransferase [Dysgonomonas sp. Marseille-P4677]MBK5721496.1 DegT/DnrJ/EryC1/StrS family aminotransferase [Dysgonomonas sp. Marseille-P4677]